MDFKVGDVVFYDWIGSANEVEIIKCYPKSDRYKIRMQGSESFELNAKVSEIFRTENDLWQFKLDRINNRIKEFEEKRDKYKSKIVESRTLNE